MVGGVECVDDYRCDDRIPSGDEVESASIICICGTLATYRASKRLRTSRSVSAMPSTCL